ncbi:MAG TPA: pectinesterase family protein [Opitutales bacterium]|nr:pectinesterase family protein [Opitutales bacterium]
MKNLRLALFPFIAFAGILPLSAHAQDSMRGAPEPVISSIDPAKLTYDILVDGNLPQDDPANKKFKTLQAAYAAASAGTEDQPTVIGIMPNVYQLPGGAPRTPSMSIRKNYITFLGLTNNRRTVVLADNRGLQQGADDDGYILDVNATGFTAKNLTIINYCNADYEYPGDASKNLTKRSDVITQAVALQAAGDKHVYDNVALLGRLDTMFLKTTRSYFKNVYIEGTDDWMGGGQISVWEDSTLVYPTGRGVMSASGVVFFNCRFEATRGMQFYKVEYNAATRPNVLIDCIVPVASPTAPMAWNRGKAPPRPNQYSLTYHVKDTTGKPAVIYDSSVGPPSFTYSREMSAQERLAYNPWNLLRVAPNATADDWDPAGVKEKYASTAPGDLIYRMTLSGGNPTIRTGGDGATLGAGIVPARTADPTITWSTKSPLVSLSTTTGARVVVTANNTTDQAEWVPINAQAANGYYVTAYVYAEPKYIDPPAVTSGPTITVSAHGKVSLNYQLDLHGKQDQSLVSWSLCDDATGANPRLIAVSRGNEPLRELTLPAGAIGKFIQANLQPKHNISDPGAAVSVTSATPIAAADIPSANVSPKFRNFVADANPSYVSGLWTVLGTWITVTDDNLAGGYGIRPSTPASFLYQQDADCGDMQLDVTMTPEKTEGTGFSIPGSPADSGGNNLHSDIYIKYDPRTQNGYALRFWRTTQSAAKCMFQFFKIENGVGTPLNDQQVLTGVFKPTTHLTLKVAGTTITATASNSVDSETLSLTGTIAPNRFGGAGVNWPRGSTNIYSQMDITYSGSSPR